MPSVALMVITDGRKNELEQTIASMKKMTPDIWAARLLVNDNQNPEYADWLEENFRGWTIIHNRPKRGFGGAIQRGWEELSEIKKYSAFKINYIFHLEEDFTFNRPIPLLDMSRVLDENPYLVQLVLKRQSCYDHEHDAGGIVELYPDSYEEKSSEYGTWTEHRRFFSTNPTLYRSSLLEYGWPDVPLSELRFTEKMLDDPENMFAFWGKKFEKPWVSHIGIERPKGGTGY